MEVGEKVSIHIEPEKCTGCTACELICSLEHEGYFNPSASRIKVLKEEEEGIDLPVLCMHCEDPICLDMCLMGAISRENESTIVLNSEACRGCKACMMACPYGAIRFFGGRMIKCDLCHGKALCAEWCPTQALRLIKDESTEAARSKKMIGMMMKSITESR